MLTNVSKGTYQSPAYVILKLLLILLLQFRVPELIQYTTSGLPLIIKLFLLPIMLPSSHFFDNLKSKLILYEQQLMF